LDPHFHFQHVGEEMVKKKGGKIETGWSDSALPAWNQTYLVDS
jgi:hypothetical protein